MVDGPRDHLKGNWKKNEDVKSKWNEMGVA